MPRHSFAIARGVRAMYPSLVRPGEAVQNHRDEILRLANKWGAKNVRVFGSAARGEGDDQSDLDLLVELEPGKTLFDLGAFATEVGSVVGRKVDAVTDRALHWYIRDRILQEAIRL
jgi:predicted nucleotidyltransferase